MHLFLKNNIKIERLDFFGNVLNMTLGQKHDSPSFSSYWFLLRFTMEGKFGKVLCCFLSNDIQFQFMCTFQVFSMLLPLSFCFIILFNFNFCMASVGLYIVTYLLYVTCIARIKLHLIYLCETCKKMY